MIDIVLSRYKRDINFIYKIKESIEDVNILVYDKENPKNPNNVPVNKGNEASVYLKYIIEHYHNLPEFTIYIHDEEYSWHHTGSILDRILQAKDSEHLYYNLNHFTWTEPNTIWKNHPEIYPHFLRWYNQYIDKYIPKRLLPNYPDFTYGFKGCAQFKIHKSLIKNFPIEFYQDLYDWITTTDLANAFSGRYLEWTWHVFYLLYPICIKNKFEVDRIRWKF